MKNVPINSALCHLQMNSMDIDTNAHISRFTFHLSRLTFHVSRFTFDFPLLKCCCLVVFLLSAKKHVAQEDKNTKDAIVKQDTLIAIPPGTFEEDSAFFFDKVSQTPSVRLRRVPDSLVHQLKNDDDFWYANTAPFKKKTANSEAVQTQAMPFYRQPWFKTLLWIIIIGSFVAIVIWYLSISNLNIFRRPAPPISKATGENEHNGIFSIRYEEEIGKALNARDHRLTIRLLYLQALRMLSEKGLIEYKAERTNSDYLRQLQATGYYKDFFRLTRDYEYVWYGKFNISTEAFQIIYNDFSTFKNRLQ